MNKKFFMFFRFEAERKRINNISHKAYGKNITDVAIVQHQFNKSINRFVKKMTKKDKTLKEVLLRLFIAKFSGVDFKTIKKFLLSLSQEELKDTIKNGVLEVL